jgi:hypothetical protein
MVLRFSARVPVSAEMADDRLEEERVLPPVWLVSSLGERRGALDRGRRVEHSRAPAALLRGLLPVDRPGIPPEVLAGRHVDRGDRPGNRSAAGGSAAAAAPDRDQLRDIPANYPAKRSVRANGRESSPGATPWPGQPVVVIQLGAPSVASDPERSKARFNPGC